MNQKNIITIIHKIYRNIKKKIFCLLISFLIRNNKVFKILYFYVDHWTALHFSINFAATKQQVIVGQL